MNEDGAAQSDGGRTESDVEFEEQLRNFELRLSQQHLLCAKAMLTKPNSLTCHAQEQQMELDGVSNTGTSHKDDLKQSKFVATKDNKTT